MAILIQILFLGCFANFVSSLYKDQYYLESLKNIENPDEDLSPPQIIKRHGYAAESHFVQTEDGYILTLFRIPSNKNGLKGTRPVFLQHGLLSSSADWVSIANISLALLLSDNGYDVWLGNARGNGFSKAHVNFSIKSYDFWDFSFHEMGVYDLPAALKYIGEVTNKSGEIIYIGHSMGCTMFFVFASIFPEVAKTVNVMVGLAPAVYMSNIRSPIKYLCPWISDIQWIETHFGLKDFAPNTKILKFLAEECQLTNIEKEICDNLIFSILGVDKEQIKEEYLPLIASHSPSSTSTKCLLHFGQEINNHGNFQQFDYGEKINNIIYGQPVPLKYNLSKVEVPTYLMFGEDDWLASPKDIKQLGKDLKKNKSVYRVPLDTFSHLDFIFGKDVRELVYIPLLKMINQFV